MLGNNRRAAARSPRRRSVHTLVIAALLGSVLALLAPPVTFPGGESIGPDPAAASSATVIAAVSDFGYPNSSKWSQTRDLVAEIGPGGTAPDYVLSTGDNWQVRNTPEPVGTDRYDFVVGRRFCEFLTAAPGPYCPSNQQAAVNRFFSAAGNHDHDDGPLQNYLDYFTLPGAGRTSTRPTGNDLYYDVVLGDVHLFVIDSESASVEHEGGDPAVATAVQKAWLQDALESSTAPWKLVALHEPVYGSSSTYGSNPHLNWDFAGWGADMVINGHAAVYERVHRNGIVYVTNALSEGDPDTFGQPVTGSQVRINEFIVTAGRITATASSFTFALIDVNGVQRDSFTLTKTPPPTITTSSLAGGTVGVPYGRSLAATGGTTPYSWARASGTLPPGLSLSSNGTISGTPTTSGTFDFVARVTDDDDRTDTAELSINVAPAATSSTSTTTTVPIAAGNGGFVGLTPARALDTRTSGPCVSGAGRELVVAPRGSVPANASAVSLNVTAVGSKAPGYLTVYPKGSARPTASNLNYVAGQTVPNRVVTKVGTDGRIVLYASGGCPDVIVDIAGYYTAGSPEPGGFVGITPARALDTRTSGPCVSGAGRELVVAPRGSVPANASAVSLNVTAVGSKAPGYLTVYPKGSARPTASNLNYVAGQTVPNQVTTKVGTDGRIVLYASGGCPDVIVDIAGYYTGGSPEPGGFVGITPARALDTRTSGPCVSGAAGRELVVAPRGAVPADASAVVLNVTAVGSKAPGYLTVYPKGSARPTASNLNYVATNAVPNAVAAKVGAGGRIVLYASGGCPDVIVDVVGYHAG